VRKCGDQRESRRFVFNELRHFLIVDSWRSCSSAWPFRVGRKNRGVATFDFVAIRISFGIDFAMVKVGSNRTMLRLEPRLFSDEDSKPHADSELSRGYAGVAPATASVSEAFILIVKQDTVADFYGRRISVELRIVHTWEPQPYSQSEKALAGGLAFPGGRCASLHQETWRG
jgi:hypothetical protein